jgi:hypothetical protein
MGASSQYPIDLAERFFIECATTQSERSQTI